MNSNIHSHQMCLCVFFKHPFALRSIFFVRQTHTNKCKQFTLLNKFTILKFQHREIVVNCISLSKKKRNFFPSFSWTNSSDNKWWWNWIILSLNLIEINKKINKLLILLLKVRFFFTYLFIIVFVVVVESVCLSNVYFSFAKFTNLKILHLDKNIYNFNQCIN